MSTLDNKTLFIRFFDEVFNHGITANLDDMIDSNFINHVMPHIPGTGTALIISQALRTAFPDLHIEVKRLVAEGDIVVGYTVLHGTHLGNYRGIGPTRQVVSQEQVHIIRFGIDGRMLEHWAIRDDLGLLQQMGVAPIDIFKD